MGCFSNKQLEGMLTLALQWGDDMAGNLRSIAAAGREAVKDKPDK